MFDSTFGVLKIDSRCRVDFDMFGSSRVELISSQKSILIKVRNCIFLYSIQF